MYYLKLIRQNFFTLVVITLLAGCSSSGDSSGNDSLTKSDELFKITAVPTQNDEHVAKNLELVSVTFSKAINPDSITRNNISISPVIEYEVDKSLLSSRRVLFLTIEEELTPNQSYEFKIDNIQELNSDETTNFSWVYTTESEDDNTKPTLSSTSPTQGSTNVSDSLNQIEIIYDEPITLPDISNLTITPSVNGSVSITDNIIRFIPSTALLANQIYQVNLSGISDAFGNTADNFSYTFTTGADTTAPSKPNNLTSSFISDTQVILSWDASTDITAFDTYTIHRGLSSNSLSNISSSTITSFSDNTVNSSTAYFYQVVATDLAGNTRASDIINITTLATPDTTPPSPAPDAVLDSSVSPTPSASQVNISWNASNDNVALNGYRIMRGINGGSLSSLVSNHSTTSYIDTNTVPSSNYQYQIIAIDTSANETAGNILDVSTPAYIDNDAPSQPGNFRLTALSDMSISFSWNVSTDNIGIAHYRIMRAIDSDPYSQIATTNNLAYTDSVVPSTDYHYQVFAVDTSGNASLGSIILDTRSLDEPDVTAPSVPSNLSTSTTPLYNQVQINWNASTDAVGVTGYRIERRVTGASNWTQLSNNHTTTSFTDNTVNESTNYQYQVFAFDLSGNESGNSNILDASTPAQPDIDKPSIPSSLSTVTAPTFNQVQLTWNASTDNVAVTGYRVNRRLVGGVWSTLSNSQSATSFTDNSVNEATNYQYQVFAFDAAGNESSSSILDVSTPDITAPSAPGNLSTAATPTFNQVQLTWNASTDNVAVAGYRVNRRPVGGSWTELVNSQSATSFTDNAVNEATSYQYQVFAFDAAGNESSSSVLDVATPDITAPSSPGSLSTAATPTFNQVQLTWNASTDNVAVTGYRLERRLNGGSPVVLSNNNDRSFTDTGVQPSSNYQYQVYAYDASGNESSSNALDVSTPALMTAVTDSFSAVYETVLNSTVISNDSVSPNSPTTWEVVSNVSVGSLNLSSNGSFAYTPATGYSGADSFSYRMRDALNNYSNTVTVNITVQAQQAVTACSTLYANNGGYIPRTGLTVDTIPSLSKPTKGNHFLDPEFGTCTVRISDHSNDSSSISNSLVPEYSRRQIFNADQSMVLLNAYDGYRHLYDANDYSYIRRLELRGGSVEFQWHPTNPDLLYRMDQDGGLTITEHDISDTNDNTNRVVADFTNVTSINGYPGATDIRTIWPNVARFHTGEEGSPSADGRYWAFMGMSSDFSNNYGLIVYDMQTDAIIGVYDYSQAYSNNGIGAPNNVSMSPSGDYLLALWNPPACDGQNGRPTATELGSFNRPCGAMAFNKELTEAKGVAVLGEHGDTAIDVNGRDVYVASDHAATGSIRIVDLETGEVKTPVTNIWNGAMHYSGKAFNLPGWIIVSTYGGFTDNDALISKVMAISLSANPVVVNLAHHRSNVSSSNYFSQPHATISQDGSKIVWGSNWGGTISDLDAYMITIPTDILDSYK